MLNKMAVSMAQCFYAQSGREYDEDDIELYAYGLVSFISTVFEILAVIIWGLCIGRLFETIVFFAAFIPLRSCAGGYHAKTALRCFLGLLLVYALFLIVLKFTPAYLANYISLFFVFVAAFPVLKYAPLADANKPIGPIQHIEFRKKSVKTFFIQAAIIISVAGFGITAHFLKPAVNQTAAYICLSFAIGQLTASGSLVAAKIKNLKGGAHNEN